jgi:hypothetical protein
VRRGLSLMRGPSPRGGGCPSVEEAVPVRRGLALMRMLSPCGGGCPRWLTEGRLGARPHVFAANCPDPPPLTPRLPAKPPFFPALLPPNSEKPPLLPP